MRNFILKHPFQTILFIYSVGSFIQSVRRSSKDSKMDSQFTGAYPRGTGAVSAVTGGNPEDINMMPATTDPDVEGPVYDGSSLSQVH